MSMSTVSALLTLSTLATTLALAAPAPDVRQLVVFDFLPGKTTEAVALFESEALPLYRENTAMSRFRGFREVESPIPLDLIVVSSFAGMAGMDESNRALRAEAEKRGTGIGSLYGRIGALSQSHHDSFVEIVPELSWGARDEGPLVVLQSFLLAPGSSEHFERFLRETLVPWEREAGIAAGGETGRYLVSDGFHFLRIHSIASLGDWHRYVTPRHDARFSGELDEMIASSREIIVAPVEELSVR